MVLQAIQNRDIMSMREISNYFYENDGIYSRVCDYFAYMYRYDWYVVPDILDKTEKILKKIEEDLPKLLSFLDNSYIKKVCGDIAIEVIKTGVYYGCIVAGNNGIIIQQLPAKYCRTRYSIHNMPVIEFNMSFFDTCFKNVSQRMKVLKLFPKDFQKGYVLYKQGKLDPDYTCDLQGCWYTLEPGSAIKFNINNSDIPIFINAIPAILDLDTAQAVDRKKQLQKLQKILVQELPLDKNGDLIFDVDEAHDIHLNAKEMLRDTDVDVLTTFTNTKVEEIANDNTSSNDDGLNRIERTVYNAFGVPQLLFNGDSSAALEKSIRTDAGAIRNLLLQFEIFYNSIVQQLNRAKKKYNFRFHMLETTQYNFEDIAEIYRKQVQMGYSKMLPMIALGHSQSEVLNMTVFENEVLKLYEVMIPPLQSSTMSAETILGNSDKSSTSNSDNNSDGEAGRPEKDTEDKSEKTLANIESA